MHPTHRFLLAALLLFGLLRPPLRAQKAPSLPDTVAVRYSRPGVDCALFPAAATFPNWQDALTPRIGRYTPPRHAVRVVERALRRVALDHVNGPPKTSYYAGYPRLIHARLAEYRRQYYGFVSPEGHRCLFINLFIEQREEVPGYVPFWLRSPVMVYDGGAAFWSIYYDLTTHNFYNFSHNLEG